jgi:hypothetical protein
MAPYLTRDEVETSSDEILAVEEGARIRAEAQAAAAGAAVSG